MYNETFYTKKEIKECKIAIISDIHYYPEYKISIINNIIKQIKDNKPDFITIVGDILDSSYTIDLTKLKDFITKLAEIAPTIIVTGNHDEKKGTMTKRRNYKK